MQLVPTVFELYLKPGTPMRTKAINMLLKERRGAESIHPKFEHNIASDDDLITKPFFWTEHVLKLFGPQARWG